MQITDENGQIAPLTQPLSQGWQQLQIVYTPLRMPGSQTVQFIVYNAEYPTITFFVDTVSILETNPDELQIIQKRGNALLKPASYSSRAENVTETVAGRKITHHFAGRVYGSRRPTGQLSSPGHPG